MGWWHLWRWTVQTQYVLTQTRASSSSLTALCPVPMSAVCPFKENRWHLLENCRYRSHEIYNMTQREGWQISYGMVWTFPFSRKVYSVMYNIGFLSGNGLIPPSNSCRISMSLRKIDSSICSDTIKSFCFQHVTEIWASLFVIESKDSVILLSREWLFFFFLDEQLALEKTQQKTQRTSN